MSRTGCSAQRVLVIKHGAFGDIVQVEGAIHDVRNHHPDAELVALTTPPYRRILERCPWIDRVLIDARAPRWRLDRMMALRGRLRGEHFGRVYDFQNSTRTGGYRRWMLPDVRWSGDPQTRDWLLRIKPPPLSSLLTLVRQLEQAGVPVRHASAPNVDWMADDVSAILRAAQVREPFVVLVAGSSARHPEKRWPYYPQLVRLLADDGFDVVTAPGPGEMALAASLGCRVLTGPQGALDWFQLAGLFRRAAFVVGNDTGPSHLAAHSGAAGVALFGPHTSPERTGIQTRRFEAIAVPSLADLLATTVFDWLKPQRSGARH